MYKLTYTNQKGQPVKLVFDSEEEAKKWGDIYSSQVNPPYVDWVTYSIEKVQVSAPVTQWQSVCLPSKMLTVRVRSPAYEK